MKDFHIGERVTVIDFLYPYKDYDWLGIGFQGIIEKELSTRNVKGMRRFLISFLVESDGEGEIKKAKLYDEEIQLIDNKNCNCCNEIGLGGKYMKNVWSNYKNEIIDTFYTLSSENIDKRYEKKYEELKKSNDLYNKVQEIKATIAKSYNVSENDVHFSVCTNPDCDSENIEEIISPDCQNEINKLESKKSQEYSSLKDLCSCATTVFKFADTFEQKMEILKNYNIVDSKYKIIETYGLEESDVKE